MTDCNSFLTYRFDAAFQLASALHHEQRRKDTNIPYISHLMAASSIVLEAGGDEDLAIAALLHDAVEDQGGLPTLQTIRRLFGDRVADVVEQCSDSHTEPKPPWRARKEAYIAHLKSASEDALLVSTADKLHNARSILRDYRVHGEQVWERFSVSKAEVLWYYRELARAFLARGANPLLLEFSQMVAQLESLECSSADAKVNGARTE
jgi:(p)ppGpp synthase/HD superfamily hydrolase